MCAVTILLLAALVWQCGSFMYRADRWSSRGVHEYGAVKPWETEDVFKLEELKVKNGYDFAAIGLALGRSEAACLQKYTKIVNSNRLSLSEEEQKRIVDLIVEYGENWDIISDKVDIPRTLFQKESIKSFYKLYQKSFRLGPWSKSEDERLVRFVNDNIARNAGGNELMGASGKNNTINHTNKADTIVNPAINVEKLRALILNGSSDGDVQNFIVNEYERLKLRTVASRSHVGDGMEYLDSSTDTPYDVANDGDADYLRVYATRPPPSWRNISHCLRRSSTECRRRYCSIILNRNMEKLMDVWYPGEIYGLFALVKKWGKMWTCIGAELGRTSVQCSQAFQLYEHNMNESINLSTEYNWIMNYYKLNKRVKLWSAQEDAQLLALAGTLVCVNSSRIPWSNIGKVLNRLPQQCFQRYKILSIKTQSPKGWTVEQNDELHALVQSIGPVWTTIGEKLDRTAYSCRAAYKRYIDRVNNSRNTTAVHYNMPRSKDFKHNLTSINIENNMNSNKTWTKQDDEYLKNRVEILGRRWSTIAEDMGKSPEDIMLRYDFKLSSRKVGTSSLANLLTYLLTHSLTHS